MKTTALLLVFLCLTALTSCKCDLEEDEPRNKYKSSTENEKLSHKNINPPENDTIQLKQ